MLVLVWCCATQVWRFVSAVSVSSVQCGGSQLPEIFEEFSPHRAMTED